MIACGDGSRRTRSSERGIDEIGASSSSRPSSGGGGVGARGGTSSSVRGRIMSDGRNGVGGVMGTVTSRS